MNDSSATDQSSHGPENAAVEMVYVVMGTTGEYLDRREWPVRAFMTEQQARSWADAAKARMFELQAGKDLGYRDRERLAKLNQYDPGHPWDCTDTDWFVYEVPLDRSPSAPSQNSAEDK